MTPTVRFMVLATVAVGCSDSRGRVADASETLEPAEVDGANETVEPTEIADSDASTACGCAYGGACAAPCPTQGHVCVRQGYPDEDAVRFCAPPAQVGDGCTNQFNEHYHPCAEGLSCLVPDPAEEDTVSLCYDCRPQRVTIVGACEAEVGVFWDGDVCAIRSGCACEGEDCDDAFASLEACRRMTERPCAGLGP